MRKILNFFTYNNAVPILVSMVLLGAGSAFAATNPESIYASQQETISVDNSYIVNKDLSTYTPKVEITGVTEDEINYYVTYDFTTIDIDNYVWKDVVKKSSMTVAKDTLGQYGDLGLYVTAQLKQIIDTDKQHLAEVQEKEKQHSSLAVVATTYSGLIGKFLDSTTETLPGYVPVVTPPLPDNSQTAAVVDGESSSSGGNAGGSGGSTSGGQSATVSMQLLGNNPAIIPLGIQYSDLGVVVLDSTNPNISHEVWVDGAKKNSVVIDTSIVGVHTVEYRAVDKAGVQLLVRRIVMVGTTNDPGGEISSAGNIVVGTVSPPPPPVETPASSTPPVETPPIDTTETTSTPSDTPEYTATTTPDTPPADNSESTSTPAE